MNLGIFLIPALSGYWLLTQTYLWKFGIGRESGYRLFFASAIAGTFLLGAARLFTFLCAGEYPWVEATWEAYAPFAYSGTISLSLALAGVASPLLNFFIDKNEAARKSAKDNGDLLEIVIQDSVDRNGLVELTTRCGKSYIGYARESGIISQGESDVKLIPLLSGYRKDDSRELVVTTRYAPVLHRALQDELSRSQDGSSDDFSGLSYEDFHIALPISEIISARPFHIDAYKSFGNDMLD